MTSKTLLANRANYTKNRTSDVTWIAIHYTGNKGDTAKNNATYFNREVVGTSAHYFVDEDYVYSSVPETSVAWHVGCKTGYYNLCRNANSIGIEMCLLDSAGNIRWDVCNTALTLTYSLMKKYGISVNHVCRHYDVTHKSCPAPFVSDGRLWEAYKLALTEGIAFQRAYLMTCCDISKETTEYLANYTYGRDLLNKLCKAVYSHAAKSADYAGTTIVKKGAGLSDETMQYLANYEYADPLFYKLSKAMV
jgi:N-acetyl-anhydromuramyl-L-alanine amidase AmpD